jgi:hypothetical protein
LPAGSTDRHSIGSRETGLAFNEDGSLTIVVTPASGLDQAADEATPNRIVAPPGEFSLYLRLYGPEERALAGQWTPPPVTRTGEVPAAVSAATSRVARVP